MVQLSRLLGELSRMKIVRLRHSRSPGHLESCWECRAAVRRERQYIERLHSAAVPEASHDLTSRLLEHTRRLADSPDVWVAPAAVRKGTRGIHQPLRPHSRMSVRGGAAVARIAGVTTGGAVLVAGVLALASYVVAGEPLPQSGRAPAAGQAGNLAALAPGAVPHPAESQSQAPSATPQAPSAAYFVAGGPVPVTEGELASLREQGWACPELTRLGFRMVAATASMHDGRPAVELELSNGTAHATVREEHLQPPSVQIGADRLRITPGTPWRAVYWTPSAVFTYDSDLPADVADDAVPDLVAAGAAVRPASATPAASVPEGLPERLQRGLRTLAGLVGF